MAATIRALRTSDARAFADHLVAHVAESGREGSPHFSVANVIDRDEVRDSVLMRWTRGLGEPLWGRALGAWDEGSPARLVGHVELRGGRVEAELHRAILSMGIQRAHTGRGLGRALLERAITWAHDELHLSALELGVFASNTRARRLYESAGFAVIGVRRDAFRLAGGVSVDDVLMELTLQSR